MQVTLDPVILDRFTAVLGKLEVAGNDGLLCAVSGGPDSLALLLLAHVAMPDRLIAATVDHGLRPESAVEADYVGEICQGLGVPHIILTPEQAIVGNIQSSARAVRYSLLERAADAHNCKHIATAHHADDQLETLLMRVARGSGVDGLSAIRTRNGRVVRPLLDFTKIELVDICANANVKPVDDPSNANTDFDRVAMRNWLATSDHPFRADRAVRTASALAEASDALAWITHELAAQRIRPDGDCLTCDPGNLPNELRRRLLLRCLSALEPALAPRGDTMDRLLADLPLGRTTTIGNIKCEGGKEWRFSNAPPRRV